MGASVVNALSAKLVAEVDRDGQTHRLSFQARQPGRFDANGGFKATSTLEIVKKIPPKRTGTRVRFWPDFEIFDPGAVIEYNQIRNHVAQVCFLVPGLKVRLTDKRGEATEPEEFVAKGGLSDYVEYLSIGESVCEVITIGGTGTFTEKVPIEGKMTDVERTCRVDVALRWVKGYDTTLVSFVNTIPTTEGGTHVAGFERALTKACNDSLLDGVKKLARLAKDGKDRAEKSDVQEGLVAAIKVTVPEPQVRGQTKGELGTPPVQSIVYDVVKDGLIGWIEGGGRKTHVAASNTGVNHKPNRIVGPARAARTTVA